MKPSAALAALVLLGGCAFASERELFGNGDAVAPFADGAHWIWQESGDSAGRFETVFELDSAGRYTLAPTSGEDPIRGVLFVPIEDTPEEDYVAQVRLEAESEAAVYAFIWRTQNGYRLVTDPGRLTPDDDLSAADPYCEWQSYQGCGLESREDVFGVYTALIHPRFVVGRAAPESYVDLLPPEPAAPPPTKDRK